MLWSIELRQTRKCIANLMGYRKNVLNYLFWLVDDEDIVSFCATDSG